jgi:hypothetical protein
MALAVASVTAPAWLAVPAPCSAPAPTPLPLRVSPPVVRSPCRSGAKPRC